MANINDIHSIIIPANTPNLSAHTYTEIYGGGSGCTMTVNNVSLTVAAGSTLNVKVRTISGGTGCYLLGENQDVIQGSSTYN